MILFIEAGDPNHQIRTEPGVVYCTCGEWWVQEKDTCSPVNEHYQIWEDWKIGQSVKDMTDAEAVELEEALTRWRRPTGPSLWD